MGEIAGMLRQIADGLPIREISDSETALTEIIAHLSATLAGADNADAVAAVAELRAALRELAEARADLSHAVTGCRRYLSALGA